VQQPTLDLPFRVAVGGVVNNHKSLARGDLTKRAVPPDAIHNDVAKLRVIAD
jgi:hypothetical protein